MFSFWTKQFGRVNAHISNVFTFFEIFFSWLIRYQSVIFLVYIYIRNSLLANIKTALQRRKSLYAGSQFKSSFSLWVTFVFSSFFECKRLLQFQRFWQERTRNRTEKNGQILITNTIKVITNTISIDACLPLRQQRIESLFMENCSGNKFEKDCRYITDIKQFFFFSSFGDLLIANLFKLNGFKQILIKFATCQQFYYETIILR